MAIETADMANGLIEVDRQGTRYLGVDTGIASNSPTLRKLAGQRRQSGWIIRRDEVHDWKPLGFVEREGRVHVYGPFAKGQFLEDALDGGPAEQLAALERVAHALATLERLEVPMFPFHTRTIILLEDGGVLVLPTDIMQAIREHQDYAARIRRMERFNHPDRDNEQNVGFALAAAAYRAITGIYPYDSDDEETLHARVRAESHIRAKHRDVEIKDDVSDALDRELAGDSPTPPDEWASRLNAWRKEGVRQSLTEEERDRRETAAKQAVERLERGFKRREMVRKKGRTALIIAAIVIVVATIPGTIIRNALQPRATAGLPPEEVVRVFYTSLNGLDHMTMEDAVVDKAGADLIREATNLFVLDRQRMSVEMESGFIDAQEWRDAGMPAVPAGKSPYGVANLRIEALTAPEGERRFEVNYERWLPDYEQAELTGSAGITGLRITDRVLMRMDREDWVIYQIDRLSQDPINLNELREQEASSDEAA
jgi:hypothetical protein